MLRALPLASTTVTDPFWAQWQEKMATQGIPHQWRMCEQTGRLENLLRCARGESGGSVGYRFNDSDIYKLLEASSYAVTVGKGAHLKSAIDVAIEATASAQMPDGYVNSHVQLTYPQLRWRSLNAMHEMYCIGHLIEAGVAHHEATRSTALLDVCTKAADHVMATFGPDTRFGYPGHEEIELALVRLSSATRNRKYADYARWLIESRGARPSPYEAELEDAEVVAATPGVRPLFVKDGKYDGAYAQDDLPLREQTRAVGHAVRAMYYYCGALDACGHDQRTTSALEVIWDNLVSKQTYVTGGIGSSGKNEGFTTEYDLPNLDAYAETCAGIGLVFWAWRMFIWSGEFRYVDVLERALYNTVLSGVSLDCTKYFYDNPLESDGQHERKEWFSCACCPPNIARLVMSVGLYAIAEDSGTVSIALPLAGTYQTNVAKLTIESEWPWSGDFSVRVTDLSGLQTLRLRVPDWAGEVTIDGVSATPKDGAVEVTSDWREGEAVRVSLPMRAEWSVANSKVHSCAGRAALSRGPVVYCLEQHDLGALPHRFEADMQGIVGTHTGNDPRNKVALEVEGSLDPEVTKGLYVRNPAAEPGLASARFVPYFSWANRGPNAMQVWVRI
ncbi:MAG TPA: beta-L-arabinofuranosidase domain-containing protein [Fimbriimonadaceae bacterium]|nr:beta-L-arabinofuranosidase domain-containing protein [Fimbriimonadaceae bacterium]